MEFSEKNDMLDSRAIILTDKRLPKWGVLPSDEICEMDDKQFEKWYHQTSDLYFFLEMENSRSLSTRNRKLCGSFTLSQDQFFKK